MISIASEAPAIVFIISFIIIIIIIVVVVFIIVIFKNILFKNNYKPDTCDTTELTAQQLGASKRRSTPKKAHERAM